MSLLRDYWRKLDGNEHPEDRSTFAKSPHHTFNLQFPPPAFVGALDAPIVILMSNGGYKPGITEAEFPTEMVQEEYRAYLRGELKTLPCHLSKYYSLGPFSSMLREGKALMVNAVPYRSPSLSKETINREIAKQLPSLMVHQTWLMTEVLPQARRGDRFVLAHRNGWWKLPLSEASNHILFSNPVRAEPNRPSPDRDKLHLAQTWLSTRPQTS
jgi:hypothetical protein